jgi:hypothetical protein
MKERRTLGIIWAIVFKLVASYFLYCVLHLHVRIFHSFSNNKMFLMASANFSWWNNWEELMFHFREECNLLCSVVHMSYAFTFVNLQSHVPPSIMYQHQTRLHFNIPIHNSLTFECIWLSRGLTWTDRGMWETHFQRLSLSLVDSFNDKELKDSNAFVAHNDRITAKYVD